MSERSITQTSPKTGVSERSAPLPHLPGLDGIRGLAVIGVLLFHGGFTWAKGGFLGVSTFFTLSGFLITNLLVREFEGSQSIDLLRFWARRLRRLMPAALAAIGLIGLVWWRIGSPEQLASLRGDMLSSVGYVANWRLWTTDVSYGSLFSEPTPFQHFWSLAIEEQFYVIFPIVALVLLRIGGRRLLAVVCSSIAAGSIALMWLQRSDFDRIYYGTDTRVAELLLGVLLALWWSGRARNTTTRTRNEPLFDFIGIAAVIAVLTAWFTIGEASDGLAKGGFPAYAALSTIAIYIGTRAGLFSRIFATSGIRWAGLLSYGLYLYHWPVFLVLSEERTGLTLAPLFVVRMMATLAIALLSYFFLEMPVRRGTLFATSRKAGSAALAGIAGVVVLAFAVTLQTPTSTVPYANMRVDQIGNRLEQLAPQSPVDSNSPSPARLWIIGDSGAMDASPALAAAAEAAGATSVVFGAGPGFGLTNGFDWRPGWSQTISDYQPDLAVFMFGGWDIPFIKKNGEAAYATVVDEAVTLLTNNGIRVMLLPVMPGGANDVSAVDRVFATVAARHPEMTTNPSILSAFTAPDGSTPRYWIGDDGTVHLLRKKDNWHLCQEGAANLTDLVFAHAERLGWAPAPTNSDWKVGPWRQAWQFNDPPGVCDGIE
jgi:peptidoglycan/LPS O-acetylase OafA/YrhL